MLDSEANIKEIKPTPLKPTTNKRKKIICGVAIGISSVLLLAGIAGIIIYFLMEKAKQPFLFLATNDEHVSLKQLSFEKLANLISSPNFEVR